MNLTFPRVILVALLLTVASQGALAGTIKAINHTRWAINAFSVYGFFFQAEDGIRDESW